LTQEERYALRIKVYKETVSCVENRSFILENGEKVEMIPSDFLSSKHLGVILPDSSCFQTQVVIFNGDCLDAGLQLKQGFNPVVLNMANNFTPGGGVAYGAGAQEESIFRRSDYFLHLPQHLYPIDGVIYTPQINVFRKSEASLYQFLTQPVPLSMIACAAIRRPQLVMNDGKLDYNPEDLQTMTYKIQMILSVAFVRGHDSIVLSALGCGAYRNPTERVAELFKQEIEGNFKGCFKKIVFAIFNDHNSFKENSHEGNVAPFERVFRMQGLFNVEDLTF
jgi:uncharacterized protein (TIGR02452 family)